MPSVQLKEVNSNSTNEVTTNSAVKFDCEIEDFELISEDWDDDDSMPPFDEDDYNIFGDFDPNNITDFDYYYPDSDRSPKRC